MRNKRVFKILMKMLCFLDLI